LKNITKNIFKILVLNDVIEKQDKNSSLEIVTNSDNFDEFFDNLIRIINNDIVLPTLYDSDGDIFNKLELAELEDDVEDAEETVEI
jgi:tellurite resistance protein